MTLVAGLLVEQLIGYISWRWRRSSFGVATVFAPLITSSPELSVFLIAILRGEGGIAWGSIVAQPFMASTIIYPAVVATAFIAWLSHRRATPIPHVHKVVAAPLLAFALPLIPILWLHPQNYGLYGRIYGLSIVALYFIYAYMLIKREGQPSAVPELWLRNPLLQLAVALAALYLGAEWLVEGIAGLGRALGLDEAALAVVLVPIATVIPESVVGLILVYRGRDEDGIGAIVGEKALYGTFYPGLAMALGVYSLDPATTTAVTIAVVVSLLEALAVWRGYFGLTAPIGIGGYLWYLAHFR